MTVLPDWAIRHRSTKMANPMIDPFVENQKSEGIISYGLSSYGYDARLGNRFRIFHNINSTLIDPKEPDDRCFADIEADFCVIPPNSYVLAHTVEKFCIPRDVLAICLGKSTYARWGIIVNVTPLEPEWEGTVTLEISNSTPCPVKIYANEGICQLIFLQADSGQGVSHAHLHMVCETSYADRQGKYQGQTGITLGKVLP